VPSGAVFTSAASSGLIQAGGLMVGDRVRVGMVDRFGRFSFNAVHRANVQTYEDARATTGHGRDVVGEDQDRTERR
jgi:hypothetical protein